MVPTDKRWHHGGVLIRTFIDAPKPWNLEWRKVVDKGIDEARAASAAFPGAP